MLITFISIFPHKYFWNLETKKKSKYDTASRCHASRIQIKYQQYSLCCIWGKRTWTTQHIIYLGIKAYIYFSFFHIPTRIALVLCNLVSSLVPEEHFDWRDNSVSRWQYLGNALVPVDCYTGLVSLLLCQIKQTKQQDIFPTIILHLPANTSWDGLTNRLKKMVMFLDL